MTQWLKQTTAGTIIIGPFVDDTDGKTAETALTLSQGDILLSKNGAAFAQKAGTANATHGTLGYYAVTDWGTADTDTLGRLTVAVHESGALPVWQHFMVVPANTWDSMIGGTDTLDVTVTAGTVAAVTGAVTVSAGTVTAVTNAVTVSAGTVTTLTDPVTVSAGTVTTVTDPVTVTGGTVSVTGAVVVSSGTVTTVTDPVTVSAGTVTAVTNAVTVSAGTVTAVTNPVTVSAGTVNAVSGTVTATLPARTVEGSIDELEAWKVALAALAGKTTGGGTTTLKFRDQADSKDVITATVDANKNRTAITLDVT